MAPQGLENRIPNFLFWFPFLDTTVCKNSIPLPAILTKNTVIQDRLKAGRTICRHVKGASHCTETSYFVFTATTVQKLAPLVWTRIGFGFELDLDSEWMGWNWIGLHWIGWIGLGLIGLGWIGWIGLDWIGLIGFAAELDWIGWIGRYLGNYLGT